MEQFQRVGIFDVFNHGFDLLLRGLLLQVFFAGGSDAVYYVGRALCVTFLFLFNDYFAVVTICSVYLFGSLSNKPETTLRSRSVPTANHGCDLGLSLSQVRH